MVQGVPTYYGRRAGKDSAFSLPSSRPFPDLRGALGPFVELWHLPQTLCPR